MAMAALPSVPYVSSSRGSLKPLVEALVANLCFFADTGRHVRSVHAAEELLRALHQDFPELISEMNHFWDFASSSITRDPTAAGITISLQKISGNVSTQLGMKAGAAAPTIATPTTAAPTGTPTAVPTTAAPTPTVIGGLSALS